MVTLNNRAPRVITAHRDECSQEFPSADKIHSNFVRRVSPLPRVSPHELAARPDTIAEFCPLKRIFHERTKFWPPPPPEAPCPSVEWSGCRSTSLVGRLWPTLSACPSRVLALRPATVAERSVISVTRTQHAQKPALVAQLDAIPPFGTFLAYSRQDSRPRGTVAAREAVVALDARPVLLLREES